VESKQFLQGKGKRAEKGMRRKHGARKIWVSGIPSRGIWESHGRGLELGGAYKEKGDREPDPVPREREGKLHSE